MSEVTKLKPVEMLNDYIAVMKVLEIPDGIEADQEALGSMSNEGIVVGIGPDAKVSVRLGDKVIIHKKRYLAICPASGGYEGQIVAIAKPLDLVVKLGSSDKFEFED